MSQLSGEKMSWEDLVGKHQTEAMEIIHRDRPNIHVQTVPHDAMVTMDFRADRVRLFVDVDGRVVQIPRIG